MLGIELSMWNVDRIRSKHFISVFEHYFKYDKHRCLIFISFFKRIVTTLGELRKKCVGKDKYKKAISETF